MSKIKLYIAASIDGYIARENHSLDWLTEFPNPDNLDYGYDDFYNGIDIVVIGRKTYEEILGFGVDWPYSDCTSYIVTSKNDYTPKTKNTQILNEINENTINKLKSKSNKNIWIVGGGILITSFLNLNAIDEMTLSVIPIILGKGIKLFPGKTRETKFEMIKTDAFKTGIVNITYQKKSD